MQLMFLHNKHRRSRVFFKGSLQSEFHGMGRHVARLSQRTGKRIQSAWRYPLSIPFLRVAPAGEPA